MKRADINEKMNVLREDLTSYLNDYILPLLRNRDFRKDNIYVLFYEDVFLKDNLIQTQLAGVDEDGLVTMVFEYEMGQIQIEDIEIESCHILTIMQLVEALEPYTEQ